MPFANNTLAVNNEWLLQLYRQEVERRMRFNEPTQTLTDVRQGKELKEEDEVADRLVNDFKIGCDPEFTVTDGNKAVLLQKWLPQNGELGYDHGGYCAELRPSPTKGTYTLTKKIRKILTESDCLKPLRKYKWRAGAMVRLYYPDEVRMHTRAEYRDLTLGGHVHFGIPFRQIQTNVELLESCDRYTKYLEALDILPQAESSARREQGKKIMQDYGQFGSARASGGDEHLEYRTPCSWLYSPQATYMALTGFKLVAANPQIARDMLPMQGKSFKKLKGFFELYQHKDTNARRAVEKLLDEDVTKLQAEPDRDFREAWEMPLEF